MTTAIRLPQRVPNVELKIYEKNEEIGGTWFENHYPGRRRRSSTPGRRKQLILTQWPAISPPLRIN